MHTSKGRARVKTTGDQKARGSVTRRDGSGHLNQTYAAELLERSRENRLANLGEQPEPVLPGVRQDGLATQLAQQVVKKATSGGDDSLDVPDLEVAQEGADAAPVWLAATARDARGNPPRRS